MKRPKGIAAALTALTQAGIGTDKQESLATIRAGLAAKSNTVVAEAAALTARFHLDELTTDLCAAFERFCDDGMSSDKQCRAKTAVIEALHQLQIRQLDLFVRGMECYWPERPYGDHRDEAAALRIASAAAYAELGPHGDLDPLVDLIADPVSDVRVAAIRALAALGGAQACLALRLKTIFGDTNANVTEECFAALLDCDKERYLGFVARYMQSRNPRIALAAVLALGRSRHPKALELLLAQWRRTYDPDFKRDILIAIALLRTDDAITALLAVLREDASSARDALIGLSHLQMLPTVTKRVEEAVSQAGDDLLRREFVKHFKTSH